MSRYMRLFRVRRTLSSQSSDGIAGGRGLNLSLVLDRDSKLHTELPWPEMCVPVGSVDKAVSTWEAQGLELSWAETSMQRWEVTARAGRRTVLTGDNHSLTMPPSLSLGIGNGRTLVRI